MATYVFKAVDLAGVPATRRGRGGDQAGGHRSAAQRGLIVLDIADKTASQADRPVDRFKRVKPAELTVMTRQLATMVELGHDDPARAPRARGADRERAS